MCCCAISVYEVLSRWEAGRLGSAENGRPFTLTSSKEAKIRQTTHHTPFVTGCPHFHHHSVMILKHERWQVEELNTHHTDTCIPTMHYHPHTRTHMSTTAHTHKLRTAELQLIQHIRCEQNNEMASRRSKMLHVQITKDDVTACITKSLIHQTC